MQDLPDDLDLLLALDVFLKERHVTRTARRLGITQGAASQKLARLREFFRDPILVPGRPLLVTTPRAQAIEGPLAEALAALRAAVRLGAPFDPKTSTRRFVLLGNDIAEVNALPPLLDVLAKEAPDIALSVERADADYADRLEKGTADAAFVPDFLITTSLRRRTLPKERFVVLLRKGHPALRRKRALDLETYLELGHVLVAPRGFPGSIVDASLQKLGRTRRVVARVQHFLSAPPIIASSNLVVTAPANAFTTLSKWLPVVALPPPIDLPIDQASMVWHERAHEDPGLVWLRGQLDRLLAARSRTKPATRRAPSE